MVSLFAVSLQAVQPQLQKTSGACQKSDENLRRDGIFYSKSPPKGAHALILVVVFLVAMTSGISWSSCTILFLCTGIMAASPGMTRPDSWGRRTATISSEKDFRSQELTVYHLCEYEGECLCTPFSCPPETLEQRNLVTLEHMVPG